MKNTSKKVILYDPYLDTLGGGEKHILSIIQIFDSLGYSIDIAWHDSSILSTIKERLNIEFKNAKIVANFFKESLSTKVVKTNKYDYLFYVTDGSYFFSLAKHNYVFTMVPDKALYSMTSLNKLKLSNFSFIVNSQFTQSYIDKWIGKNSTLLYPYIDTEYISFDIQRNKKEKIILSVGRFFGHLHSKRHDEAIKAFLELKKKSQFKDFKLVLIGGLKDEDLSYYNSLRSLAQNDPDIIFKTNLDFKDVVHYFYKASYYWLFAGYGIDDHTNPEQVEHLGITPLEAISTGCITFAYNTGGPKEIIKEGQNGFLFSSTQDLIEKMLKIYDDESMKQMLIEEGKKYVTDYFSYEVFKENVLEKLINNRR